MDKIAQDLVGDPVTTALKMISQIPSENLASDIRTIDQQILKALNYETPFE